MPPGAVQPDAERFGEQLRQRERRRRGQPSLPIRNPYLGVNFVIALEGIFPARD
jgi:hypothetical protein